jgi:hypothetical protein
MRTYTEQPKACFSRALVYAKSSTSRWIASRSRKLSARSCLEGHCGPYALRVRAAAAEVFVVVVRFMGPLMGGLWVWEVVGVTQCCHRQMWQCEGRDSPPLLDTSLVITCGTFVSSATPSASTCSARCCGCPGLFLPLSSAVPSPPG